MGGAKLDREAVFRAAKSGWPFSIAALALCAGLAAWWFLGGSPASDTAENDAPPVRVEVVQRGPFVEELKALGTITPLATVSVKSRVDGELVRLHFREGQHVARGQVLAEIDPRPFRAILAQARGERQQNEAQLVQARRELRQHQELAREGFTSQTKIDQQQALIGQYSGAVAASDGRIADARLQLEFAAIRAPIAGRIGIRGIDAGNLVRSGDTTEIATITQMKPISAMFTLPETQIDDLRSAMRDGALEVQAWDRGERTLLATGRLTTIDNRIDPASGTLRLRGEFANADERLFPNQFVNIRLALRTIPDALTISDAALQRGADGPFVYIVDAKGIARKRAVEVGNGNGERILVLRGLKPGERIVLEGFDSVRNGEAVEIIAPPRAGARAK